MQHLAEQHGEHSWRAHAFPLSVDGIEIVASLALLYHRRSATRAGPLRPDRSGSGRWPATALLVAVKLLAGLLDGAPGRSTTTEAASAVITVLGPGGPGRTVDGWAPADQRTAVRLAVRQANASEDGRSGPESAALTIAVALSESGERLTRQTLTQALRSGGHTVYNTRAGELLTLLRTVPEAPVDSARERQV